MSKETSLIKKYELQISKLENALKEAENAFGLRKSFLNRKKNIFPC